MDAGISIAQEQHVVEWGQYPKKGLDISSPFGSNISSLRYFR